jgi:hypothetical protein
VITLYIVHSYDILDSCRFEAIFGSLEDAQKKREDLLEEPDVSYVIITPQEVEAHGQD